MLCPICDGETIVSGSAGDETSVLRRRKCKSCGYIFMTIEICSYDNGDSARYYALRDRARRDKKKQGKE